MVIDCSPDNYFKKAHMGLLIAGLVEWALNELFAQKMCASQCSNIPASPQAYGLIFAMNTLLPSPY